MTRSTTLLGGNLGIGGGAGAGGNPVGAAVGVQSMSPARTIYTGHGSDTMTATESSEFFVEWRPLFTLSPQESH